MLTFSCLTLLLNIPGPTAQATLLAPSLRWPALEGTVRLVPTERGGETGTGVCIGFRDPWAYFLTASHVLPDERNAAIEFFRQADYPKPVRRYERASLLARSEVADLAVFRVVVGSEPPAMIPLAKPGQRPKRFPVEAVSFGCPARSAPEARQQTILAKKLVRNPKLPGGLAYFWEVAAAPQGGMSGGPLLDREGQLIGICVAHQNGKGYFAHTDEILALLNDNGLRWIFDPPPSMPEK